MQLPSVEPSESPSAPAPGGLIERLAAPRLRDRRDVLLVKVSLAILATVFPSAALLFLAPAWVSAVAAIPYLLLIYVGFGGRYMLMLHVAVHRPLYRRDLAVLDNVVTWVFGPFFGMSPTSFHAHHVGMHHAEGNLEPDLSCTMSYRRDHFGDFLKYWARFFFLGHVALTAYMWRNRRYKLARRFWAGEVAWLALVAGALLLNPAAAAVVFLAPFLITRFLLMAGNFAQHAFVDAADPGNPYKNSTNLTATPFNDIAYNDGYHIVHHLKPGMHWADMPREYEKNVAAYAENDALIFAGVYDNIALWFRLMTRDYGYLADRVVQLQQPARSRDETIAWLRARTRPIPQA